MRSGIYAIVDGVEYEASLFPGGVAIYIPDSLPRPDGWKPASQRSWGTTLTPERVSEMYEVRTSAKLDNVDVSVESVEPSARKAVVRAKKGASINDQGKPPPHPLLEAVPESSYSLNWMGTVPWDRLTDVNEACGRVDPATGGDLLTSQATWTESGDNPPCESHHPTRSSRRCPSPSTASTGSGPCPGTH